MGNGPNDVKKTEDDSAKSMDELKDEIKKIAEKQDSLLKTIGRRTKIIAITIPIIIVLVFFFSNHYFMPTKEIDYGLKSNYEIEDLKGDKIGTWVSWKINQGDVFHIHVQSSPEVTDARLDDIKNVIFNNDTITINNQTYYKGWSGALAAVSNSQTKFPIPIHFHTIITDFGTGNIVIRLTNLENEDGYDGYTKSIMDVSNHQILKSEVTIYNVNKLSDHELRVILRHELGHAFGLEHSTDPNDLMYPEVGEDHSYISQCDIEALAGLYNGDEKNQVTCQK